MTASKPGSFFRLASICLLVCLAAKGAHASDFAVSDLERPATASNEFGAAVAAEAGFVAVGDPGANRVYIYQRLGNALVLDTEIPLDPELIPIGFTGNPRFGASLALVLGAYCLDFSTCSGHTVVIGAPAIELVDIWTRNNPVVFPEDPAPFWEPILWFDTGDFVEDLFGDGFGQAVSITEELILIGAPQAPPDGEVYLFSRNGEALIDVIGPDGSIFRKGSTTRSAAGKGGMNAGFGTAIANNRGKLTIGAPQAFGTGMVQLYDAVGSNLTPTGRAQGEPGDEFGSAITMSGDLVATGAPNAEDGAGAATVFDFEEPQQSVFTATAAGLTNVGSSVALEGEFLLAGASAEGQPTAILRSAADPEFELRFDGDLVAGASAEVFVASDAAAGEISVALDQETLFASGMER
ncbi:MAG: hypothetical protein AAGE01_11165 [Pseudomonadota bacterium]